MRFERTLHSLVLLAALGIAGCGSPSGSDGAAGAAGGSGPVAITGAGSTFINPAMSQWAYTYQQAHSGVTINYRSVGSGAGIGQYKAGTVDFGATDAPLTDAELQSMPAPTTQIPMISGCEVLAYNLPGVDSGLKLSGDVIADIYLGKIKTWNDPRIEQQNPGVKLPAIPIAVAHRSDGSGTTYIFTDYLCSVSPAWKSGPGKGKTVNWPLGVGGQGNEGVAGDVKATPGGLGYIELAYAVQTKLTYGPIRNSSGKYVEPSIDSTTAAIAGFADALAKDNRASVVNGSTPDAYPIAGMTYVLVAKTPKDANKGKTVVDFLNWALGDGQEMAKKLQYAPLPSALVDLDKAQLAGK